MAYQPPFILIAKIQGPALAGASGLCTLTPSYDPTGILGEGATSFDLASGMYLVSIVAGCAITAAGTVWLNLENSSDIGNGVGVSATGTGAGVISPGVIDDQVLTQFFLMGDGNRTVDLAYASDTGGDITMESSVITIVRVA